MNGRHDPSETSVSQVTVECAASGPSVPWFDDTVQTATLADLEAFTAELRRLGAGDDTAVVNAIHLSVTMNRT